MPANDPAAPLTPEEKIAAAVYDACGALHYLADDELKRRVAAAIREAENDTLERAAVMAEGLPHDEYSPGYVADRIRALKRPT